MLPVISVDDDDHSVDEERGAGGEVDRVYTELWVAWVGVYTSIFKYKPCP